MSHAKVAPLSRGGLKHDVIHANAGLFCDENISMDDVITIVFSAVLTLNSEIYTSLCVTLLNQRMIGQLPS